MIASPPTMDFDMRRIKVREGSRQWERFGVATVSRSAYTIGVASGASDEDVRFFSRHVGASSLAGIGGWRSAPATCGAFPASRRRTAAGAFLIPWLLFLFTWSIPLLIAEFGLGRGRAPGPDRGVREADRRPDGVDGRVRRGDEPDDHVLLLGSHRVDAEVRRGGAERGPRRGRRRRLLGTPTARRSGSRSCFHVAAVAGAGLVVARGGDRRHRAGPTGSSSPLLFVLLLFRGGAGPSTLPGASRGLAYLFHPGTWGRWPTTGRGSRR